MELAERWPLELGGLLKYKRAVKRRGRLLIRPGPYTGRCTETPTLEAIFLPTSAC